MTSTRCLLILRILGVLACLVSQSAFTSTPPLGEGIKIVPYSPDQVMRLEGSPYEMGKTQGRLNKTEIATLNEQWLKPKVNMIPLASRYLVDKIAGRMYQHLTEDMKAELQGMADGSEQTRGMLMVANAIPDILELVFGPFGCSVLAVSPQRSQSGAPMVLRNLDYSSSDLLRPYWRPILYAKTGTRQILGVELPGFIGLLTAINDRGVMMARLTSQTKDATADAMPVTLLFRKVLEQAESVQEAIALVEAIPRSVGSNFIIADSKTAVVTEVTHRQMRVRPINASGVVYAANHFESQDIHHPGHDRDERWIPLSSFDQTRETITLPQIRDVMCQASSLPTAERASNILGVMFDYASSTVYWASEGGETGKASCGPTFKSLNYKQVFESKSL